MFCLFTNTLVFASTTNERTKNSSESKVDTEIQKNLSSFFPNAQNFILDHTPQFIKNSVNSAIELTGVFRQSLADKLAVKQVNLELEIQTLDKQNVSNNDKTWKSQVIPMSKKIELFFTNIFLTIFSSVILFYSFSIIILILFIRFIWIKIL